MSKWQHGVPYFSFCVFLSKFFLFASHTMIFLTASIATSDSANCTRIPLFLLCHYQRRYHNHHLADKFADKQSRIGFSSLLITIVPHPAEHSDFFVWLFCFFFFVICVPAAVEEYTEYSTSSLVIALTNKKQLFRWYGRDIYLAHCAADKLTNSVCFKFNARKCCSKYAVIYIYINNAQKVSVVLT